MGTSREKQARNQGERANPSSKIPPPLENVLDIV